MNISFVWAVHQGDTATHSGYPKWFFTNEMKARAVASGRGWLGGNAPISQHKCILVNNGNVYLLAQDLPIKLDEEPDDEQAKKQKALSKLTLEERKLLGL